MNALDRLIPTPRMVEIDRVDLTATPEQVWERVRHGDLARSPLVRALFALRTLPSRLRRADARTHASTVRIDDLVSSPENPGFQILVEEPWHEFAVGAIGKVWQVAIPFVHVANAEDFAAFAREGFVKVAWAIRVSPWREHTHLEFELRVDATDEPSWRKFRRYFRLIGPASRFIRRSTLAALTRELGTPSAREHERPLPGDELLGDAKERLTHFVDIAAPPEAIWPWLVQMGCRRAGFYSYDFLDNGGVRSAREIHPELQSLPVGDVIPATPRADDGFEVLRVDRPRVLVLGGLYDAEAGQQLPFAAPRPARYWHVTWSFVLEPLDERSTRLYVRARAASPKSGRLHRAWIRPVHHFMETAQLRRLAARVEGRLPRDDGRDVLEGVGGAAIMTAALLTPFLRGRRCRWGLDAETAARPYPGDELVPEPRWMWTHGIEIEAAADAVWPWIAQVGADRGGFYSYQWLENIAGCRLRNAETVHPEWAVREGDGLVLHPELPPLRVVSVERGRYFVAHAPADARARAAGKPWVAASWLFLIEPLGATRSRFISRYRADGSRDLATRWSFGPALVEPIGFAMDRRMLIGVKERVEAAARAARPHRVMSASAA